MSKKPTRRKAKNQPSADNGCPPRPPIQPMAITLREAAAAASISLSSLYLEIKAGRLRVIKVRGSSRVLITDLLDFLGRCPPLGPSGGAK